MALNAGSLAADLANRRELAPFWLVTGSEDLLMLESADMLRRRARELGYTDRQVLELSASADWSQLPDAAASIGMFDDKKFLEVRLPSGRPGIKGNKALPEFVERPVDGVVTLFTMPRPDWQGQKAAWWQALVKAATVVECDPVERAQLPQWLAGRMRANGQTAARDVLEAFADLVEGNLLAAKQEVGKLSLLFPQGELTLEQIEASVGNCSRYTTEALVESFCTASADRTARIVDGLEAQGEPLPFLLAILTNQIRSLIKLRASFETSGNLYVKGVFATNAMKAAARRIPLKRLAAALDVCAMNTHSHTADCRTELFCTHAALCGADREVCTALYNAATTDACLEILDTAGLREPVLQSLLAAIQLHLDRRAGGAFRVGAVLFSNQHGPLGQTETAARLLNEWKE